MPTLAADLAAVRREIHHLHVDMTRPTYPGWPFEHRHNTEQALAAARRREAALVARLAAEEERTRALTAAADASGWPLLYAIAHVTAGTTLAAQETAMLNPIVRWEPGTQVRYHGSLTDLHGLYRAHPCACLCCDDPGIGSVRYQLCDEDGTVVVSCVRPTSITPARHPDPEPPMPQPSDPSPEEIRAILAERRLRCYAWDVFERSTRRAAMRAIKRAPDDDPEPDTNAT